MLQSPHLVKPVSLAATFAVRTSFSLSDGGTRKKARPTGHVFLREHIKRKKQIKKERKKFKGRGVFEETATNYDVPSLRICVIYVI